MSQLSFAGFDSFAELRRGYEFNPYRSGFYPPPDMNNSRGTHGKKELVFSIASVSDYGMVINPGSKDPFDFGMPQLADRPSSEAMSGSMSLTVDDTFSFLNREPRRQQVDSDASSFYFRAPAPIQRGHRRGESTMSVASGPPISLYNRSFGVHRRNDSNASASSLANSYAVYSANGGRAAWVKHRQDSSLDSALSDFSLMRLGRPGLGDKMLESGLEHGMPLTAISASPPESTKGNNRENRSSFDSIMTRKTLYSTRPATALLCHRIQRLATTIHAPVKAVTCCPDTGLCPCSVFRVFTVRQTRTTQ
jgi:hypothetical protein